MGYSPEELQFAKTHEWVAIDADVQSDIAVVGISRFAVDQLTDILLLDLPPVGKRVEAGEAMFEIESVKAVADVYAPVTGEVVEVNAAAAASPESLVKDPYGTWLVRIRIADGSSLAGLLSHGDYIKEVGDDA